MRYAAYHMLVLVCLATAKITTLTNQFPSFFQLNNKLFGDNAKHSKNPTITASTPEEASNLYYSSKAASSQYSKAEINEIRAHDRKLIVGGQLALRNTFRYMTALVYNDGSSFYQFCGASLISDDVVLTAAHCVVDSGESQYFAAIGRYQLTNLTEPGELIRVSHITVHPLYNDLTMFGDIAILKLEHPVTHPFIRTIDLVDEAVHQTLQHGSLLTVTGWGTTTDNNYFRRSLSSLELPADCNVPPSQAAWLQDGYCDESLNNPSCNYDGGDCCAASCDCESISNCYQQCGSLGFNLQVSERAL